MAERWRKDLDRSQNGERAVLGKVRPTAPLRAEPASGRLVDDLLRSLLRGQPRLDPYVCCAHQSGIRRSYG